MSKPTDAESAAWHREQAAHRAYRAKYARLDLPNSPADVEQAQEHELAAAHHTRAAEVLESLQVVRELLLKVSRVAMFTTYDGRGDGTDHEPTDNERAALRRLTETT